MLFALVRKKTSLNKQVTTKFTDNRQLFRLSKRLHLTLAKKKKKK